MAPTFRHGKSSRLVVSTIDASSLFSEMTLSHSVDAADVTTFAANDRSFIAGQRDATISASGLFEASTAKTGDLLATFRSALGSTTNVIVTAIPGAPGGSTITPGSPARMGALVETAFEINAPANGVVVTKFDGQSNDRFDFGRTLHGPAAAKTSTFAGTAVDSGVVAGTTSGGVAHFHVTAASTVTSVTYKVQHSSNNSVWSDLATFTSTDVGSQRTVVTGTVKRYTRATITAFTGGAAKSVKTTIAFARRGATI